MSDFRINTGDLSFEDKIDHVQETISTNWLQSYHYDKENAMKFQTTSIPPVKETELFRIYLSYMTLLFEELIERQSKFITNPTIKEELSHWDKEGGLCIYMSVLLYGLLKKDDVLASEDLKLVQGYNSYRSNNPLFEALFGCNHTQLLNFHVWLSYRGAVIDISVAQERVSYQFGDTPYILGEIPDGFEMVGFLEDEETIKKYMEKFSSRIGMSVDEWLLHHKAHGLTSVRKAIEHFSK